MPVTNTVPNQPTAVQRQEAMRGIYAAVPILTRHLPVPLGVKRNGAGSDLLIIDLVSIADLREWADYMRFRHVSVRTYPEFGVVGADAGGEWAGWQVTLTASESLAAAVAAVPTDPGGHACADDCDCDTARQSRSLYDNLLLRQPELSYADTHDGHPQIPADILAHVELVPPPAGTR